jgi:tetratricopeptide (TPR) repeat protein
MKTSTTISSLARIYVSSIKLGGAGRYFAPGQSFGSFAGTVRAHLSSQASEANLRKLGNQLAAVARSAHLARQPDVVEWATQAIVDLPLPSEFRSIADFYRAYRQRQQGEIQSSRIVFARIADEAAPGFRERAMLVLGINQFTAGDFQGAARYYIETARAAQGIDLLTSTQASWNLAIVRSADGDHHGALQDLERLAPVIGIIGQHHPTLYYDYLNSLAVEMSAVGRNKEAKQIITKLLALPTARRSQAWRETAEEIALNEARGVSCPPTFAIWTPTDTASTPGSFPAPVTSRASLVTNPGIDASSTADRSSAAVTTNSLAETAPAPRQRSRVARLCSIDWGVASSKIQPEVASAISAVNLQTAFAPISGGCLPGRSLETRPARRVRNRQLESVPVPGEYPRFPLPRAPTNPT